MLPTQRLLHLRFSLMLRALEIFVAVVVIVIVVVIILLAKVVSMLNFSTFNHLNEVECFK